MKHYKEGIKGSFLGTQTRFNEFLKPSKTELNHIPGYMGFVPSIRAENLHSRTYGDLTRIVKANEELRVIEGDQFYGMIKDNCGESKLKQAVTGKLEDKKQRMGKIKKLKKEENMQKKALLQNRIEDQRTINIEFEDIAEKT